MNQLFDGDNLHVLREHLAAALISNCRRWPRQLAALLVTLLLVAPPCLGQGPKPIKLDRRYQHDRWETRPNDIIRKFQSYTVSFDSDDDDDRDGTPDRWAIPQWVAYEVKRIPGKLPPGLARPSWFTDLALYKKRIARTTTPTASPQR